MSSLLTAFPPYLGILRDVGGLTLVEDRLPITEVAPLIDAARSDMVSDGDASPFVIADWLLARGDPRGELVIMNSILSQTGGGTPQTLEHLMSERDVLAARLSQWTLPPELGGRDQHRFDIHAGFITEAALCNPTIMDLYHFFKSDKAILVRKLSLTIDERAENQYEELQLYKNVTCIMDLSYTNRATIARRGNHLLFRLLVERNPHPFPLRTLRVHTRFIDSDLVDVIVNYQGLRFLSLAVPRPYRFGSNPVRLGLNLLTPLSRLPELETLDVRNVLVTSLMPFITSPKLQSIYVSASNLRSFGERGIERINEGRRELGFPPLKVISRFQDIQ